MKMYHGKSKNYSIVREILELLFALVCTSAFSVLMVYAMLNWFLE